MAKISSPRRTSAEIVQKRIEDIEVDTLHLKKSWEQHKNMEEKLEQQEEKLIDKIAALQDKVAMLEDKHQISEEIRESLDNRLDAIDL